MSDTNRATSCTGRFRGLHSSALFKTPEREIGFVLDENSIVR
jgi:hypothetical protein